MTPSSLYAREPNEGLQWNRDELDVQLSLRYFIENSEKTQFGPNAGKHSPLTQSDLSVQYPFFQDEKWGKLECYIGVSLFTHWDVPDRMNLLKECGYTFLERFRIEVGHLNILNIGRSNDGRGLSSYWAGGSVVFIEGGKLHVDGYGRYYLKSNLQASIQREFRKELESPLTAEVGVRARYLVSEYVYLALAPYLLFDDSFSPARLGTYALVHYEIGRHLRFVPDNVSLEFGGEYGINSDFRKDEKALWIRLNFELK